MTSIQSSSPLSPLASLTEDVERSGLILQSLDVRFISSRPARYGALLDKESPAGGEMKIKRDGFVFYLDDIAYVYEVEFTGEATGSKPPTLKVEGMPVNGGSAFTARTQVHPSKPNVLVARFGKMIRGIRVSPEGWTVMGRLKISHVDVIGRPLDELEAAETEMTEHVVIRERFRAEVTRETSELAGEKERLRVEKEALATHSTEQASRLKAEAEAAAIEMTAARVAHAATLTEIKANVVGAEQALVALGASVTGTKDELAKLSAEKAELEKVHGELVGSNDANRKRESDLIQHIAEKTGELARKTDEVGKLSDKLRKLESDVSMYAENLDGFAKQGDRDIKSYMPIIYICLGIGAVSVILTLWYTLRLPAEMTAHPSLAIKDILILKSFVVLAFVYIVKLLMSFANPYLVAIRAINDQRRNVNALSMLAREIVDSVLQGEGAGDEDRVALRLAVKMQWMQDVLPEIIGVKVAEIPTVKETNLKKLATVLVRAMPSRRTPPIESVEVPEAPRSVANN